MSLARAARQMQSAQHELETVPISVLPIVFVSYAHEDEALRDEVTGRLAAEGYDVWSDARIAAGQNFHDRIGDALTAAVAVLVLWSDHSIASEWVCWEAEQALKRKKLLPVAAPELDKRDIRPPFYSLKTLDFGRDEDLLKELRHLERRAHESGDPGGG